MTDFMTYHCHYFFIRHNIHQTGADTYTTVTAGKGVYVYYFIYAKVKFQSVHFFDMSRQFLQTFAIFSIRFCQWIMSVHPCHIFLTHISNVRIR